MAKFVTIGYEDRAVAQGAVEVWPLQSPPEPQ